MKPEKDKPDKEMPNAPENAATSSKLSSSKTRSRTSDFIKKTIQGAREILSSIHQPRPCPEGRVHIHTQPRIDFDVSFEEVDFVIDPDLINLCRELNAKFQYSSDSNLSGQPSFQSAISCVSFQDVSITTDSNGKLQINKPNSPNSSEEKQNDEFYHEIPRTSTFIVFPSESNQTNPPATNQPSSKAFLILQSNHSNRPATEKTGDIPAGTTFLILQSDGAFKRDTTDQFDQNVTVKLVNMNSENTGGNKHGDESNPLKKQMKPFRIFTFDTLPKSRSHIVESKSFISNDKHRSAKEPRSGKENKNHDVKTYKTRENNHADSKVDKTSKGKHIVDSKADRTNKGKDNIEGKRDKSYKHNRHKSVKDKYDAIGKTGTKDYNTKDKSHRRSTTREKVLSRVHNISTQDVKSKAHVSIARLGTTAHPETSLLGKETSGKWDIARVEMVTVDPMFSSITKFDTVGSMQIIQRPVRGRSRNFRSPEKKFGIYDYPMQTPVAAIEETKLLSQPQVVSETQEEPEKQNIEKPFDKSETHQKSLFQFNSNIQKPPASLTVEKHFGNFGGSRNMLSIVEQSHSTLRNSSESFYSNTEDLDNSHVKKQDSKIDKADKMHDNKKELDVIEEDMGSEKSDGKNRSIEITTDVDTNANKTVNEALETEVPCNDTRSVEVRTKPSLTETNMSYDSNRTYCISKKSSPSVSTNRTVSPPLPKVKASKDTSESSVSKAASEQSKQSRQSSSRTRNCKPALTLKPSQSSYYSQLKDRADEIRKRMRSNSERDNWYLANDKSKTENTNPKSIQNRDSKKNELKEKIRIASNRQKSKDVVEKLVTYNAKIETTKSYIVMSKKSYVRMKHTDKSVLDTVNKPVNMRRGKHWEMSNVKSKRRTLLKSV